MVQDESNQPQVESRVSRGEPPPSMTDVRQGVVPIAILNNGNPTPLDSVGDLRMNHLVNSLGVD